MRISRSHMRVCVYVFALRLGIHTHKATQARLLIRQGERCIHINGLLPALARESTSCALGIRLFIDRGFPARLPRVRLVYDFRFRGISGRGICALGFEFSNIVSVQRRLFQNDDRERGCADFRRCPKVMSLRTDGAAVGWPPVHARSMLDLMRARARGQVALW